jgi:hypothetical protein
VAADITMPPFPTHPDQVVRVHRREIGFPKPVQEVLQRREANFAPSFLVVEILAEAHHRPDLRVPPQADMHVRLMLVESIVPCRIGFQSIFMRPNENEVVRRGLGRTRERQRALDHIREAHCPFIGLLGTHRPAEHQFQPLDAVALGEQPVLRHDIVTDGDMREAAAIERRRCIARRR